MSCGRPQVGGEDTAMLNSVWINEGRAIILQFYLLSFIGIHCETNCVVRCNDSTVLVYDRSHADTTCFAVVGDFGTGLLQPHETRPARITHGAPTRASCLHYAPPRSVLCVRCLIPTRRRWAVGRGDAAPRPRRPDGGRGRDAAARAPRGRR